MFTCKYGKAHGGQRATLGSQFSPSDLLSQGCSWFCCRIASRNASISDPWAEFPWEFCDYRCELPHL